MEFDTPQETQRNNGRRSSSFLTCEDAAASCAFLKVPVRILIGIVAY
jgi:hypothetical protein